MSSGLSNEIVINEFKTQSNNIKNIYIIRNNLNTLPRDCVVNPSCGLSVEYHGFIILYKMDLNFQFQQQKLFIYLEVLRFFGHWWVQIWYLFMFLRLKYIKL